MEIYKLTDADGFTRRGNTGETIWVPGEPQTVKWGGKLCADGCLHAYQSPLVGVFMDPIQANLLPGGRLWRAEGVVEKTTPTKLGCSSITLVEEIEVPQISLEQRVEVAIRAAMLVPNNPPAWSKWAENWLAGNRDAESAESARAESAAWAASAATSAARAAASKAGAVWAARAAAAAKAAKAEFDLAAIIESVIDRT